MVLAVRAVPVDHLAREMEGNGIEVITIGDAMRPRKMNGAILQGFEGALNL